MAKLAKPAKRHKRERGAFQAKLTELGAKCGNCAFGSVSPDGITCRVPDLFLQNPTVPETYVCSAWEQRT